MRDAVEVSVIVPTLDGGDQLVPLVDGLSRALEGRWPDFEIVLVDDGSRPPTWQVISRLASGSVHITGVRLTSRAGQLPAFFAGVSIARGRTIVAIDDDFEIDPALVVAVLEPLGQGFDAVSGWRDDRRRQTAGARIALSSAYWTIMRTVARIPFRDPGCGLKAFQRSVLDQVLAEGGNALIGLRPMWAVARHAQLATDVQVPWRQGRRPSSYRLWDLIHLGFDLVTFVAVQQVLTWAGRPPLPVDPPFSIAEVTRTEW